MKKSLSDSVKSQRWPIYIYGGNGLGKTCAAAWLYRCWNGETNPFFARASWLIEEWLGNREIGVTSQRARIRNTLGAAEFAVIDEIGTRRLKDIERDALLEIIELRANKKTVYTSNLSPEEFGALLNDTRIVSRLSSGCVIEVTGNDRRIEKALRMKA